MQLAELDRIFAQTNPPKTIRFRHGTCTEVGQDSACPALGQRCLDVGPAKQPSIPGADGPCLRSRQLSAHKPRRLRDYPNRPAVRWSDFRFRPPREKARGKQRESMFFRLERKHFSGFPRLWHQSCYFKFLAGNQARCLEVTRFGDALPGHLSFLLEVSPCARFLPMRPGVCQFVWRSPRRVSAGVRTVADLASCQTGTPKGRSIARCVRRSSAGELL